jgi:Tol biopolymer transport system component
MKRLFIPTLIFAFLVVVTILVVLYGKGYRFGFDNGVPALSGTGLLVATSTPNGASVFVNGHLTTATDNTINLAPGTYQVKISKEGYFPWEKTLIVKKEVVAKADALLFPSAPKLESITNTGIMNPVLDPSLTKIAYTVASQSALRNGVFVLDMSSRPILTLQAPSSQIADETNYPFSSSNLAWSPDGTQIIATIPEHGSFLLSTNNANPSPKDITETFSVTNAAWEKQIVDKQKAQNDALPQKLRNIVKQNFNILQWSNDETKILYEASDSATIPQVINPPLIGTDSTTEERTITKGAVYVYDIKEDKNFKILDSVPKTIPLPVMWYPDSEHLVYVHDGKIDLMEYDGQNQTTVYAGPFVDNYVFPWPDATSIVILTNLGNPNIAPNLYTVSLK